MTLEVYLTAKSRMGCAPCAAPLQEQNPKPGVALHSVNHGGIRAAADGIGR